MTEPHDVDGTGRYWLYWYQHPTYGRTKPPFHDGELDEATLQRLPIDPSDEFAMTHGGDRRYYRSRAAALEALRAAK